MKPLACPHCKEVLPAAPPGITRCPRCQGFATIPGPADIARAEKKRREEKTVLMAVAAVFFVIYVAPVLLMFGYMCLIFVVYFGMMIAAIAAA